MSQFGDNLQYYRKRDGLTQEALAEKLDVSRQTVSKWESGAAFAEMEKILQICELFDCDLDTLLRQSADENDIQDDVCHRAQMQSYRTGITAAIVCCILACAVRELIVGLWLSDVIANGCFGVMAIIGVLLFIVKGMQQHHYRKVHPVIQDFYTEKEKEAFAQRFPVRIATGVGTILVGGVVFVLLAEGLPKGTGPNEDFYYGLLILSAAIGVGVLVYNGLKKAEYNVVGYNRANEVAGYNRSNEEPEETDEDEGGDFDKWSEVIMLSAGILYILLGFAFGLWHIAWIVVPIGFMACEIAETIQRDPKEPSTKNKSAH